MCDGVVIFFVLVKDNAKKQYKTQDKEETGKQDYLICHMQV